MGGGCIGRINKLLSWVYVCVTYACVFLTKDDLLYLTQKALGFSRFLIPELPSKKASPLIFSGKSGLPRFYQKNK